MLPCLLNQDDGAQTAQFRYDAISLQEDGSLLVASFSVWPGRLAPTFGSGVRDDELIMQLIYLGHRHIPCANVGAGASDALHFGSSCYDVDPGPSHRSARTLKTGASKETKDTKQAAT